MATTGEDLENAHWVMLTMDGAGLTHAESGVRVAMYLGSVELLNQSVLGIRNLTQYRESTGAEAYVTLRARTSGPRPQLCKIFRDKYITTRPTDRGWSGACSPGRTGSRFKPSASSGSAIIIEVFIQIIVQEVLLDIRHNW